MKIEITQEDYNEILSLVYKASDLARSVSPREVEKWEGVAGRFTAGVHSEGPRKTKIMEHKVNLADDLNMKDAVS